jgi:hypothetical protein
MTALRPRFRGQYEGYQALSSEVDIEFEPLQKLVGKITAKWGWSETVTKCRSPYSALIYSWSEALEEAQRIVEGESEDEQQARTDLAELLNIISTSSGHLQLDRYFQERDTFISENSITHDALWTLFPPGTLILAHPFLEKPQIFSVQSCDGFVSGNEPFDLICYSFDWNGFEFNRVAFEMRIESWGDDRKSIVELPFYPLDYYEESSPNLEDSPATGAIEGLKNKLINRGKRYEKLCTAEKGKQMFNYEGNAHLQRSGGILQPFSSLGSEQSRRADDNSSSSGSAELKISSDIGSVSRKQVWCPMKLKFTRRADPEHRLKALQWWISYLFSSISHLRRLYLGTCKDTKGS